MSISAMPLQTPPLSAADALLQGYAGPAFYAQNGKIISGNTSVEALSEQGRGWWKELEAWLATFTETGSRTPILIKVPTAGQPVTLEWSLVVFDDAQVLLGRNVTLERNLQNVLTESRDRFRDLVDLMAELAWEVDSKGIFTYVAGATSFGYPPEALLGKRANDLVVRAPMDMAPYFEPRKPTADHEGRFRLGDGAVARVLFSAKPLFDTSGTWIGARGLCRDVTAERERQEQLAHLQQRDRMLARFLVNLREAHDVRTALSTSAREIAEAMKASGVLISQIDDDGTVDDAAQSGMALPERVYKLTRELDHKNPPPLIRESTANAALLGATIRHGATLLGVIWLWRPASEGEWESGDLTLLSEITDHLGIALSEIGYQNRLRALSERDGLTGLLNRRTFMERLKDRLDASTSSGALFYFDLDNFKAVNDTHGHQRGDQVIMQLAKMIQQRVGKAGLAGRVGGDEFVVWFEGQTLGQIESLADAFVARGNAELGPLSASADKPLGLSIGVVYLESIGSLTAQQLLEQADKAMYAAKNKGKNAWASILI